MITRENAGNLGLQTYYRRKPSVEARRMDGSFQVQTPGGVRSCNDGYVAIDIDGNPGAIPARQFEQMFTADVQELLGQVPVESLIAEVNRRYQAQEMQNRQTAGDPGDPLAPIDLNAF